MSLLPAISLSPIGKPLLIMKSDFLNPICLEDKLLGDGEHVGWVRNWKRLSLSVCCSAPKLVRDRSLDRHVVRQNKTRFLHKLRILLLSKPKHFMPIHILVKCCSYLALDKPRSIVSMIQRYPTIFELFYIPYPQTPLNAAKTHCQLCVRLTPRAEALSAREAYLKSDASITLANKLQRLLMLSSHRRLVLSKLAHLGSDLGLPPNFRSRLCNEHPDKFKTVDTSYGRALELVSWNPDLANPLVKIRNQAQDLIVDRPLKFKLVKLRKGMNVKRHHHDFLIKFEELPDICPYKTSFAEFPKNSLEAEKRACCVVREILGMAVEKRTLVDHLTHFRKDFGLSNKLRGMLVRHPELFYVSLKGQRDSVFLVEAYNANGELIQKEDPLIVKDQWFALVSEGKKIRRKKRWELENYDILVNHPVVAVDHKIGPYDAIDEDDALVDLFDSSDFEIYDDDSEEEYGQPVQTNVERPFWSSIGSGIVHSEGSKLVERW